MLVWRKGCGLPPATLARPARIVDLTTGWGIDAHRSEPIEGIAPGGPWQETPDGVIPMRAQDLPVRMPALASSLGSGRLAEAV